MYEIKALSDGSFATDIWYNNWLERHHEITIGSVELAGDYMTDIGGYNGVRINCS